jgi:hypothetical protein
LLATKLTKITPEVDMVVGTTPAFVLNPETTVINMDLVPDILILNNSKGTPACGAAEFKLLNAVVGCVPAVIFKVLPTGDGFNAVPTAISKLVVVVRFTN